MANIDIPDDLADQALGEVIEMIKADMVSGYRDKGTPMHNNTYIKKFLATTSAMLDFWVYAKTGVEPGDLKAYEKYRNDVYRAVVGAIERSKLPFKIAMVETTESAMMEILRKSESGTLKTVPKEEGPPSEMVLDLKKFKRKNREETP